MSYISKLWNNLQNTKIKYIQVECIFSLKDVDKNKINNPRGYQIYLRRFIFGIRREKPLQLSRERITLKRLHHFCTISVTLHDNARKIYQRSTLYRQKKKTVLKGRKQSDFQNVSLELSVMALVGEVCDLE